jgi:DNA-binding NtrC family response regulator
VGVKVNVKYRARVGWDLPIQAKVLVIDDDPSHLRLYAWILERGGYTPVTALVQRNCLELPDGNSPAVVVLDYALGASLKAADVARQVRSAYPAAPIIIRSDLFGMPDDVAPLAAAFVQKGDPQLLLETIAGVLDDLPAAASG